MVRSSVARRGVRFLLGLGMATLLPLAATAQAVKEDKDVLDSLSFAKPETWITSQTVSVDEYRAGASRAEIEALAPVLGDWDRFLTDRGGRWIMLFDRVTGRPAHMEGRGIPWIPGTANGLRGDDVGLAAYMEGRDVPVAVVAGRALDFLAAYPDLFGVKPDDLALVAEGSGPVLDYLYFLNFQWTYHGIPVEKAHLIFRLNHGNLVQAGQEFVNPEAIRGLDPAPAITAETAWQILYGFIGGPAPQDRIVQPGRLLVVPVSAPEALSRVLVEAGQGLRYRLVYEMSFHRPGVMGTWQARVDAHNGELLEFVDANRYGSIQGGVYKTDQPATEVVVPFPYADYSGSAWADIVGSFPGTSGTSTMTGRTGSSGNVGGVDIVDNCGTISLASDGSGLINFGTSAATDCSSPGGGAGNTRASRTQYYNVTMIKIKAYTYLPGNTWLQGRITDNVNIADTCNAYWNGSSINFFRSGGGCWNTGELPGVSLHEWAHGLDSNDGSPAGDNGTGETYGDFSGVLQTHGSCAGGGFFYTMNRGCGTTTVGYNCSGYGDCCLSCSGIREIDYAKHTSNTPYDPTFLDNSSGFNCDTDPSYDGPCGYEGHCESLISSQAMWDLPVRDLTAWGLDAATAWQLMDRLWYASRSTSGSAYACPSLTTSNGCTSSNYFTTFRVVDDCDGDLSNGTPHASAIYSAFNRHKIACTTVVNTDQTNCCPDLDAPVLSGTAGNTQASLSWGTVSGAVRYYVYRNETGCDAGYTKVGTVTAPSTSYTDTPLSNGVTYYYRVQAIGSSDACVSPMSNCVTVTPAPCTTPGTPTIGTVTVPGDNQLSIPWSAGSPAGATYKVYRAVGTCAAPGAFSVVASGLTTSPYLDSTVSGGTTYSYRVSAVDSTGGCESLQSSCAQATATGACTLPPAFGGLASVTNPQSATCTLELSWSAGSSGCGGTITYNVYRSETSGFTPSLSNRVYAGWSGTSYTDSVGLTSGTTYYYVVRAYDSANGLEDGNLVERSGMPTGGSATLFSDTFEGGNLGWTFAKGSPAAATGDFVIGDPVGTTGNLSEPSQPEDDHTASPGVNCLYTAENPTGAAGTNDVDGGEVIATSPLIDISGYASATLSLWRWFLNEYTNDDSGDYYYLEVSNNGGSTWVQLESLPDSVTGNNAWTNVTFQLENYVGLTATMRIRVRAADGTAVGGLIEAAIDDVQITGFNTCTTGTSCTDPGAPEITGFADESGCAQSGIRVSYTAGSGATSHNLLRDGSVAVTGYASGALYNPGDTSSHSYAVQAVVETCTTDSDAQSYADGNETPGTPSAPTVTDADACALTGVNVSWGAVPGATAYDLLIDGTTTVSGVTSPHLHEPGDSSSHTYAVRARTASCSGAWSGATAGTDVNGLLAPAAPLVADVSACALSGVQITWHTVAGATAYDLLVDGTTTVSGVTSPHVYAPGDSASHTYAARGRSASCTGPWSNATAGTDANGTPGTPAGLSATATAYNNVDLSWGPVGGASAYHVYRATGTCPQGAYTKLTTGGPVAATTYSDGTASGSTTYAYVVTAVSGVCESSYSACAEATTPAAPCINPPAFSGLSSVTAVSGATCSLQLTWNAAASSCGGGVTYNVYRDTASGFTPGPANQVESGLTGTAWTDASVQSGTTYYYVVRAVETLNGLEDTNATEHGAAPGLATTVTLFSDSFETGTGLNGWATGFFSPDTNASDWQGIQTCTAHGGTRIFRYGGSGCTDDYTNYSNCQAVPGGTAGLSVPAGAANVKLSFWHRWQFESNYDGAMMRISFDNATYYYLPASAPGVWLSGGYNGTVYYPAGGTSTRDAWTGTQSGFSNVIMDLDAAVNYALGVTTGAAGRTIWIGFGGFTDVNQKFDGWFLDDVAVTYDIPGTCTSCAAPSSVGSVSAADLSACAANGIGVSWPADPGSWGDASGTRTYDVLRDGSVLQADVAYGTTSVTDATALPGVSYTYSVRYKNACGLEAETAGALASDDDATPAPAISGPSSNTCPTSTVELSTEAGMTGYQWYQDGSPVGSDSATHTAAASGTYTVSYTNGSGCSGTSTGHAVTISPCMAGEVSGSANHHLKAYKNGSATDIVFEDVTASHYQVYVSNSPNTSAFQVADAAYGKRDCAWAGWTADAESGMLRMSLVDLENGITGSTQVLYFLVTADNGFGTEGTLGVNSSGTTRTADAYCDK